MCQKYFLAFKGTICWENLFFFKFLIWIIEVMKIQKQHKKVYGMNWLPHSTEDLLWPHITPKIFKIKRVPKYCPIFFNFSLVILLGLHNAPNTFLYVFGPLKIFCGPKYGQRDSKLKKHLNIVDFFFQFQHSYSIASPQRP